jgi:predicted nucleic acid-binding protein
MRSGISATSVGAARLLDTGPLVALLSKRDDAHDRCRAAFEKVRATLLTTEAVLTEAMHLLGRSRRGQDACLEFVDRAGAILVPTNAVRLGRCRELIARYANVPMDYADATLVALAEDFGIGEVFTLDRRGFETYRWRKTQRFVITP